MTKPNKMLLVESLFPKRDDGLPRPVHISDSIKSVMKKIEIVIDRKTV